MWKIKSLLTEREETERLKIYRQNKKIEKQKRETKNKVSNIINN